eukprot:1634971-Rhodomonas_salina.1
MASSEKGCRSTEEIALRLVNSLQNSILWLPASQARNPNLCLSSMHKGLSGRFRAVPVHAANGVRLTVTGRDHGAGNVPCETVTQIP